MPTGPDSTTYSITLPKQVVESIMKLRACGLFGNNRGEITRQLVLDAMKSDAVQKQLDKLK